MLYNSKLRILDRSEYMILELFSENYTSSNFKKYRLEFYSIKDSIKGLARMNV